MLVERLKDFKYYKRKLPLYMQNSYGIVDQFKIIYDILYQLDATEDDLLNAINIFDKDYLTSINSYSQTESDILDKLAILYGYNRVFDLTYKDDSNTEHKVQLRLTNEELLILIKASIIQHNFDGSLEMATAYYKSVDLPIYMITDNSLQATCNVYFNSGEKIPSDTIKALFYAGLLTIKSLGILYNHHILDLLSLMIWDVDNESDKNYWDKGVWA